MTEKEIYKKCNKQETNISIDRFKPKYEYMVLALNLNGQNNPSRKTMIIRID